MTESIHSFSDFAETRHALDGKKVRIDEILNKPITVVGQRIIPSKRNDGEKCLHLQFELGDALHILFTGSGVLIDQCEKYSDKIPFRTEIKKIDKYFTFV